MCELLCVGEWPGEGSRRALTVPVGHVGEDVHDDCHQELDGGAEVHVHGLLAAGSYVMCITHTQGVAQQRSSSDRNQGRAAQHLRHRRSSPHLLSSSVLDLGMPYTMYPMANVGVLALSMPYAVHMRSAGMPIAPTMCGSPVEGLSEVHVR